MSFEVEIAPSLGGVASDEWDRLVDDQDPFMEHAFLRLLETSESVGPPRTGWIPRHILVREGGELVAALPLYLKTHSYGEFIFDFRWAQAAYGAGVPYYPKLVSAAPLTPATGSRMLRIKGRDELAIVLIEAARAVAEKLKASSLHVLFHRDEDGPLLAQAGLARRLSYQYHFTHTGNLRSFDDFMSELRSPSRKQVRKERQQANAHGLSLMMQPVSELPAADLDALYNFYRNTIDEKGSEAYLTRAFFTGLGQNARAFVAMARDGQEPVAGALFFYKGQSLFGRYWGAVRPLECLHFELCYYLPMEWGLLRGMRRFEAGAQGEHKIKRGFLPSACHSAHWARHPGLQRAIAEFVEQERPYVEADMAETALGTPFKRL